MAGSSSPDSSSSGLSSFLDRVHATCRRRQFSRHTKKSYRRWIVRYVKHHGTEHPRAFGNEEVRDYLSHFATDRNVAAATQNQALNGLLFLHRDVLGTEWGAASDVDRAKEPERTPQKRGHQTAPPLPVGRAEGGRSASRRDRHHQVGRLSHAPTLVCTRSSGAGCRPPNGPRTPWPPGPPRRPGRKRHGRVGVRVGRASSRPLLAMRGRPGVVSFSIQLVTGGP